jgi:hypothetical protein
MHDGFIPHTGQVSDHGDQKFVAENEGIELSAPFGASAFQARARQGWCLLPYGILLRFNLRFFPVKVGV